MLGEMEVGTGEFEGLSETSLSAVYLPWLGQNGGEIGIIMVEITSKDGKRYTLFPSFIVRSSGGGASD